MLPARETLLCSYRYDPLDRLVDCTPSAQPPTRRFYLKDRLATEIQDAVQRSIMQHDDQLLAQQQRQSGAVEARLLATDQQRSVLNVLDVVRPHPLAYSPYGHRPTGNGLLSLLGFNGERPDPVTGCYLLGNGYRAFNPVLMRFNSPDSWSPFGKGGLNAYAYCVGDPVSRGDPTGHVWKWLKPLIPRRLMRNNARLRHRVPTPSSESATTTASPAVHSQSHKELMETIASQQKTIESQQKTIVLQQKHINSTEETIQLERVVVSDYRKIISQQEALIDQLTSEATDLREDLIFSLYINPVTTRTQADVAAVYGSHSASLQTGGVQSSSSQSNNTAIRSM